MSDRMNPLSCKQLITWIFEEYETNGSAFGIRNFFRASGADGYDLFGSKIETLFGPAAGPHTQLAENIVAAYLSGSRFFELKTVQKLDGEDLPVSKPCIKADDEGYNVEWSTELRVPDAFDEYVKAWVILHVLAKEWNLGSPDGFVFNMSVGYDLDGIKTKKIDDFIEGLKEAKETESFKKAIAEVKEMKSLFRNVTEADIDAIPSSICNSITLSTLHGCPPQEIERIATYLISEKKLNTFIKCNPTLLGYDFARSTLDSMGYDYIAFSDFHFKDDLQYADAVPMLQRLMKLSEDNSLSFGVKITNTFPVDITSKELPGQEMYMSGRSLYPLSINLASKLSKEFEGKLRISYSGGADVNNIADIIECGIYPVTMATTMLKPGGYMRLTQIGDKLKGKKTDLTKINLDKLCKLAEGAVTDKHHVKEIARESSRKITTPIPMTDCFMSSCEAGCPIHQDIGAYMEAVSNKDYMKALEIIMDKNPLPFTTGTICAHRCMNMCTRNFYDSSVRIRDAKLTAAENAYESALKALTKSDKSKGKVAVVGAGPAGIAAAYYLLRENMDVTVFSDSDRMGGTVSDVIPEFRIMSTDVDKDVSFIEQMGVEFKGGCKVTDLCQLDEYDFKVLAFGAPVCGKLDIDGYSPINAIEFLKEFKQNKVGGKLGKAVVVIGGGNTAMDTARAAKRVAGVESVSIVYRRDRRNMPAEADELVLALAEGIKLYELCAPVSYADGKLKCEKNKLGNPDASGRRSPVPTGEFVSVAADSIIAAVGEKVDSKLYSDMGLEIEENGYPKVDIMSMKSSIDNVYIIGDGRRGPKTVVEAIADALVCAKSITGKAVTGSANATVDRDDMYSKKGIIKESSGECDYERCLNCKVLCENCVDVCPNRANVEIRIEGKMPQIIHVDRLCNECGNCATFCPYTGAPYKDKLTLFANDNDLLQSDNNGFFIQNKLCKLKIDGRVDIIEIENEDYCPGVEQSIMDLVSTVYDKYEYLWK